MQLAFVFFPTRSREVGPTQQALQQLQPQMQVLPPQAQGKS